MRKLLLCTALLSPSVLFAHAPAQCEIDLLSNDQGRVAVYGDTLASAKVAYAAATSQPRRDCDPSGSGWICASFNNPRASDLGQDPQSPVLPSAPPATTTPSALKLEAESATLSFGWSDIGGAIQYRGPNRYNISSRRDDSNLEYTFQVPQAGEYRFTMRSRAVITNDPSEPANDVWVRFGDVDWIKAYVGRDGSWQSSATGERGSTKNQQLLTSYLPAGSTLLKLSGRSDGFVIDNIELVLESASTAIPSGRYNQGDLLVLAHDYAPDPDDMQAIIANREILDEYDIDTMVLSGTKADSISSVLSGSLDHTRELFPDALDATASSSVDRAATAWQLTLDEGASVWVAEGGPSDFTAAVVRKLVSRGVGNLKRIHVVQHNTTFNEAKTSSANIALVKQQTSYVTINDGNAANATPDFNSGTGDSAFRTRALASQYGAAWARAFSRINNKVDFSDSVELMYILDLPKSHAPSPAEFASRYF